MKFDALSTLSRINYIYSEMPPFFLSVHSMIRTNANEEKNQVVYPTLVGCNIVRNWEEAVGMWALHPQGKGVERRK